MARTDVEGRFLFLPSNADNVFKTTNTATNFKSVLSDSIFVDRNLEVVGLAEITYTSFFSLFDNDEQKNIVCDDGKEKTTIYIPDLPYNSIYYFVSALREEFTKKLKIKPP